MPLVRQMPCPKKNRSTLTVAQVEAMLEEWFGSPVVLTSSGRGALMLAFGQLGLNRYRNRIAMSPMISTCVVEAVAYHAFPVDAAAAGEFDADTGISPIRFHAGGPVWRVESSRTSVTRSTRHQRRGRRVWLANLLSSVSPSFFQRAVR